MWYSARDPLDKVMIQAFVVPALAAGALTPILGIVPWMIWTLWVVFVCAAL
jgi:hypothetical protein